jgi:hypothetical protein
VTSSQGYFFVGARLPFNFGFTGIGVYVIVVLGFIIWTVRERLDRYFLVLLAMYGAVCASILWRQPEALIHPFFAGPRYFFYPFIILSWILVWVAVQSRSAVRVGIGAVFAIAIVLAIPGMQRRHDPLDWRKEVLACAKADKYDFLFTGPGAPQSYGM